MVLIHLSEEPPSVTIEGPILPSSEIVHQFPVPSPNLEFEKLSKYKTSFPGIKVEPLYSEKSVLSLFELFFEFPVEDLVFDFFSFFSFLSFFLKIDPIPSSIALIPASMPSSIF